jgi:hypothetical protein
MAEPDVQEEFESAALPLWREPLVGVEWLSLRASGVFRCIGVPRGDGSVFATAATERPETAAEPNELQHARRFAEAEVATPSNKIDG